MSIWRGCLVQTPLKDIKVKFGGQSSSFFSSSQRKRTAIWVNSLPSTSLLLHNQSYLYLLHCFCQKVHKMRHTMSKKNNETSKERCKRYKCTQRDNVRHTMSKNNHKMYKRLTQNIQRQNHTQWCKMSTKGQKETQNDLKMTKNRHFVIQNVHKDTTLDPKCCKRTTKCSKMTSKIQTVQ